jgi:hypothetical protein
MDVPGLKLSIKPHFDVCLDVPNQDKMRNVVELLELARENTAWRDYRMHSVEAVTFHNPQNCCHHNENRGERCDARLHITFAREHKKL